MRLSWVREPQARWSPDKERIIGATSARALMAPASSREPLPGSWWHVEDTSGRIVGYGWLRIDDGAGAEALLAVDEQCQQQGVGSYVLARLEQEASVQGARCLYNFIQGSNKRDLVHDWLVVRGFSGPPDGLVVKRLRRGEAGPGLADSSRASWPASGSARSALSRVAS